MERKIGEIFEFGGEWYQCIIGHCNQCCFDEAGTCKFIGDPYCAYRNDKKLACFKKLEKVGEPYTTFVDKTVQNYLLETEVSVPPKDVFALINNEQRLIAIEIKQNKEDMEDNRTINQHFAECGQTINDVVRKCYTENKSTQIKDMEEYKMQDAKENIPEFDKVIDECLYDKQELKLKPFDLQKAKAGKPVCMRNGRKARIICFDAKRKDEKSIIALVPSYDYPGFEDLIAYPNNGNYQGGHENDGDLMMLPEKKEGWVNVYRDYDGVNITKDDNIYSSKEAAIASAQIIDGNSYVATTKINWEE